MKGQVLADFVVEFSPKRGLETVCHVEVRPWRVFVDDASCALGAGARIIIITAEGIRVEYSFRLSFKASNNEAEYEALLAGLRAVLEVYSDSRLVVNQVVGNFEAKNPWMISYLWLVKQTMSQFQNVRVIQIAWEQNRHVDSLATLASSLTEEVPQLIKVEVVAKPSIDAKVNVLMITVSKPYWMDPIIDFLAEDCVSNGEKEQKGYTE